MDKKTAEAIFYGQPMGEKRDLLMYLAEYFDLRVADSTGDDVTYFISTDGERDDHLVEDREHDYRGITYGSFLIRWRWQYWLWRKLMCRKNIHLLDEVLSSSGDPWPHYLVCDACQLMIHVDRFDDTYVVNQVPDNQSRT